MRVISFQHLIINMAEYELSEAYEIDEKLIEGAKGLLGGSDLTLMASSLGSNENAGDNYKMAVSLQLKQALNNLNYNLKKFNLASKISSWIMISLTILIAILTLIIIFISV